MSSFFTALLLATPHFKNALIDAGKLLDTGAPAPEEELEVLVKMAYYCAYLNLPEGIATADSAIRKAGQQRNERLKAYATCAKSMSLYRMGFTARARECAAVALGIFSEQRDQPGISETCYHISTMVNLNIGIEDTSQYLQRSMEGYEMLGDETGCFLVRIQQAMVPMYEGRFDKSVALHHQLLDAVEASCCAPHLRCIIYHHLAHGMYMKPDIHQSKIYTEQWHTASVETGNFHDFTRTSCMLTEYYRQEHLDKSVVEKCIQSIEYCVELGSYYGYATSAFVMGNICVDQGQFRDAISYYEKVNEAAISIQYIGLQHMALAGIGTSHLRLGDHANARRSFEILLQKSIAAADSLHQTCALRALAELALDQACFDDAFTSYRNLFEISGGHTPIAKDYGNYAMAIAGANADVLSDAGVEVADRHTLQLRNLMLHLRLAVEQKHQPVEASAYDHLADYYEETGDLAASLQYRKKYIALYSQIVNAQNNNAISALRMQYEAEKKDSEIALLKKEKAETLLLERLRISRNLHDDMGATLSSISVYSSAVKQRLADERMEEAQAMLDQISSDARDMVSNMSDMVWMINPQNDRMENLLDRMELLATGILGSQNVVVHFTADEALVQLPLSMDSRKNIFLIFKEAVNNIAKYACATEATFRIQQEYGEFQMTICDNGKGFDTAAMTGGNGLQNMRERAVELSGRLTVRSAVRKGTTVALICTPHN